LRNRLSSFHAAAGCDLFSDTSNAISVPLPIDDCSSYQTETENRYTREFVLVRSKQQNHDRPEKNFVTVAEFGFSYRHLSSSMSGGRGTLFELPGSRHKLPSHPDTLSIYTFSIAMNLPTGKGLSPADWQNLVNEEISNPHRIHTLSTIRK
jgi:hypothetical protein